MKKTLKRIGIITLAVVVAFFAIILFIFRNELKSLASIKKLDDHPLISMNYYGDYGFDEFLKVGAKNDGELVGYIIKRLLRGFPFSPKLDFSFPEDGGCTVFVVKNEKDEILYCRNYDFLYTPAMQLFTSPNNGHRSVSTVQIDAIGYTKSNYPTGININSVVALGTPYAPWDGMNEKGLAIGLLAVTEAYGPKNNEITLSTTTII